ncbi:WD40/YVTN/BNR-like repeat-containing protein [Dictyobacter formicarum]|uniref:Photosynthesis system II assembly factor Ycf48/Hcf136-like domain-containing protein n=1 Tax=Dictyobacter formicarum TaxID=2778368 RepID=A0ABQ3VAA3_9CHLR|nr:hypothetical protein [Dictyobacter formicarum]GHO82870.1 hypothetical protein KSZ_08760 [Dictyobacter formicarum]
MYYPVTKFRVSRFLSLGALCLVLLLILAACGTGSGILNAGGSWQPGGISGYRFRSLATDPNNPQKIFAGSEQGAIFVSADSGVHWVRTKSDITHLAAINTLSFDKAGKQLYAASDSGLWSSTNGGQSWNAIASQTLPADKYTALAFDMKAANHVYVGTARHGIFMSADAGNTWATISKTLPSNVVVNGLTYDSDQHQLWAATSAGIYRTADQGANWTALNTGLPAHVAINAVVPAALIGGEQGRIYAGTEQGFFISTDNGAHWAHGKDSLSVVPITSIVLDFRSADAKTIYIGTGAGALQSDDQGQTWRAVAPGLPKIITVNALALGGDHYAQLLAAMNDVYLYPGNSGGGSSNIFPIVLFIGFFALLYYFAQGRRKRRLNALSSPAIKEESTTSESETPSEQ